MALEGSGIIPTMPITNSGFGGFGGGDGWMILLLLLFACGGFGNGGFGGGFANDEKELDKVVYKKEDYFVKENEGSNITWLVTNSQKNHMEPIMVTIQPKCQTDIDYPHEGQEFGYVLEGEILLCIDKKTYRLKKGETFYFDSTKNHYLKNVKDKVCRIIWVSSPPNF